MFFSCSDSPSVEGRAPAGAARRAAIVRGPAARLALLALSVAAPWAFAVDHTTYVVALPGADRTTLARVEAAGGVVDHFDGDTARAYVHIAHWNTFLTTGIAHTIEEVQPAPEKQLDGYPTYAALGDILDDAAAAHPDIVRLVSLGQSVQGREIWALRITDNPDIEEDEPEFAYISTMHGDEKVGTVLCLNFLDLLLDGYGADARITAYIDETEIWLVPLMNPDGYELGIRWNANNRDLNRSFPSFSRDFTGTLFDDGLPATDARQPEVAHVMNWTADNSLVLLANYHAGALVVNYPYDEEPGIPSGTAAPTPDEPMMRAISLDYARLNPPMSASLAFPDGVTNGSAWYSVDGGMQDWHYRFTGAIDLTLEVSVVKSPNSTALAGLWEDNRDAMFAYLDRVHRGARGIVTDRLTGAPLYARVLAGDNSQPVFTDPEIGDFYRLLLPGAVALRVDAPGYIPYTTNDITITSGDAIRADVALSNGDVNGDGQVNAADLQLAINAVLELNTLEAADVDGRGVSATDVQHLVNWVLYR